MTDGEIATRAREKFLELNSEHDQICGQLASHDRYDRPRLLIIEETLVRAQIGVLGDVLGEPTGKHSVLAVEESEE